MSPTSVIGNVGQLGQIRRICAGSRACRVPLKIALFTTLLEQWNTGTVIYIEYWADPVSH